MTEMIPVSKVEIPANVRKVKGVTDLKACTLQEFSDLDEKRKIEELMASIEQIGLLNPITVRESGEGFQLIAGFRRLKAVEFSGGKDIEAKIVKIRREDEIVAQLTENIHREDLPPMDIARTLEEIKQIKGFKTQNEVAKSVNKSAAWVSQYMGLLKAVPEVQESVEAGEMGVGAARQIAALPKEEQKAAVKSAKKAAEKEADRKNAKPSKPAKKGEKPSKPAKVKISSKSAKAESTKAKVKAVAAGKKVKGGRDKSKIEKLSKRLPILKEEMVSGFIKANWPDGIAIEQREAFERFFDFLFEHNIIIVKS
jgi:ParB family chromosome partitioning protein